MKHYRTKNQFIYSEPTIIGKLALQFDAHVKKYKVNPRKIYVTNDQFYELAYAFNQITTVYRLTGFPRLLKGQVFSNSAIQGEPCLLFRGVPIVEL